MTPFNRTTIVAIDLPNRGGHGPDERKQVAVATHCQADDRIGAAHVAWTPSLQKLLFEVRNLPLVLA